MVSEAVVGRHSVTLDSMQADWGLMKYILAALAVFLLVIGTVGNVTIIYLKARREVRRCISAIFMLALAVSDLLNLYVGLLLYVLQLFSGFKAVATTTKQCAVLTYVHFGLQNLSTWILVAFNVERCQITTRLHVIQPTWKKPILLCVCELMFFFMYHVFWFVLTDVYLTQSSQENTVCGLILHATVNNKYFWPVFNFLVDCLFPIIALIVVQIKYRMALNRNIVSGERPIEAVLMSMNDMEIHNVASEQKNSLRLSYHRNTHPGLLARATLNASTDPQLLNTIPGEVDEEDHDVSTSPSFQGNDTPYLNFHRMYSITRLVVTPRPNVKAIYKLLTTVNVAFVSLVTPRNLCLLLNFILQRNEKPIDRVLWWQIILTMELLALSFNAIKIFVYALSCTTFRAEVDVLLHRLYNQVQRLFSCKKSSSQPDFHSEDAYAVPRELSLAE